jgi:hypothetical protein
MKSTAMANRTRAAALMRNTSSPCLGFLVMFALITSSCGRTPTEPTPTPACTFTLSTLSLPFGADGGSGSVAVTTASACAWTATSDRAWMSITSGASGTGSGTVGIVVAANAAAAERTGALTVAGQAVSVRQEAAATCRFTLSPASASFGKDGVSASFAVSAGERCSWSAASDAFWLTIESGGSGTGNGTITYAIERNRQLTSRTGTIAVADQLFTVTQAGDTGPAPVCDYSVRPVEFTLCMTAPTMSATITTQQGCTWTAEPDASWITLTSGPSGSGSGMVSFKVTDNWDAPRRGVVKIRWPTETAGQNLQIQQAGCTYAVSTTAVSIPAVGGPGRFDVLQQSDPYTCGGPTQNACMWIAQSDVPWITVTTPMPQFGDNPVGFSVAPNDGTLARTGRISVRDKTVVVTQVGK